MYTPGTYLSASKSVQFDDTEWQFVTQTDSTAYWLGTPERNIIISKENPTWTLKQSNDLSGFSSSVQSSADNRSSHWYGFVTSSHATDSKDNCYNFCQSTCSADTCFFAHHNHFTWPKLAFLLWLQPLAHSAFYDTWHCIVLTISGVTATNPNHSTLVRNRYSCGNTLHSVHF